MSEKNDTYRRRIHLIIVAAVLIWAALAARLYYLQVLSHEELSLAAASQYQVVVDGMDTRGAILDRNLQPLTGGTPQYYYFLKTEREDTASARLLAAVSARQVSAAGSGQPRYSVYRTQMFDENVNQALKEKYGAYVFKSSSRYSDSQTACHLIGYLNASEQKGVAGLERRYEGILKADGSRMTLWADSGGSLLLGIGPQIENGRQLTERNLITSIDSGVQSLCETALSRQNINGAVLVSEAETGQILAWASSPVFNPNALTDYLTGGGDNLVDKCIQGAYAPGSVFKVVTAAAALEYGIAEPSDVFECTGRTEVEGVTLGCQAGPEGGHGQVDMYQAMAVSCNCYFAQLGAKVGYEKLLQMAQALGFGECVLGDFAEETEGNLPDPSETGQWDISNLSIGQGSLLTTPMQVQQMMSAVAGGGVMQPLTVVTEEADGSSQHEARRVFSPSTAEALSVMLGMVMSEGTGSGVSWSCPVYGKTGTAETVSEGAEVKNCWFSGWCRVNGRSYVVTVLAEDGVSGSGTALPVFQKICGYLQERNFSMETFAPGTEAGT